MKNYTLPGIKGLKALTYFILLSSVLAFTGCKDDDDGPVKYTNIRFVNAINEPTGLDMYLDDSRKKENLAFGSASEYFEVTEGNHKVSATNTGSITAKVSTNFNFKGDASFSVYGFNNEALAFEDTSATAPASQAWVRYINLSPTDGAASYVIKQEGSTASFDFAKENYKQTSAYKPYAPAAYTFTALDFETSGGGVTASTGSITLTGGKAYTIFLTGKGSSNTLALKAIEE